MSNETCTRREWVRLKTFTEWMKEWCANCRGGRKFWVARDLLFGLPDLMTLPNSYYDGMLSVWHRSDEDMLKDYFTALYLALDVTLNDPDRELAAKANRAVNIIISRIVFHGAHRLPDIHTGMSHNTPHWAWEDYRQLPRRLLGYYSHHRSYSFGNEHWEQQADKWTWTVVRLEEERMCALEHGECSGNIAAFDWPGLQVEPDRTQFLRCLILAPYLHRPYEFPEMLPDFFSLLVDARDSWLAEQDNYPRKPKGEWPSFAPQHSRDIVLGIYELGLELGMPPEQIQPAPFR